MFAELAKSAIEFFKLAPHHLIAVAIFSGVLLFLPDTWPQWIGLNTFATANHQWLDLTFLVSAVL